MSTISCVATVGFLCAIKKQKLVSILYSVPRTLSTQGYVGWQNCTSDVIGNISASARPINILNQLRNTPCYLLDTDIKRYLKGPVVVENTQL